MPNFYIGDYSVKDYVDNVSNKHKDTDFRPVIKIIADSVFGILEYNKDKFLTQYTMSTRLEEVLEYDEKKYEEEEKKGIFIPDGLFARINIFVDALNSKKFIKRDLGTNYPNFNNPAEENNYLQKVSEITKSCVLELIALYLEDSRAKINAVLNSTWEEDEQDITPPTSHLSTNNKSLSWSEKVLARGISTKLSEGKRFTDGLAQTKEGNIEEWEEKLSIAPSKSPSPDKVTDTLQSGKVDSAGKV